MSGEIVNVENFARAETNRILAAILRDTGGINRWMHNREPTPLDHQPVIRQNRDTLYSASVIDVSKGVTITMPDGGDRYMSAMLVNQDHYVMAVLHEPGEHELSFEQLGTPYVLLAVRTLVDPVDPADVAAAQRPARPAQPASRVGRALRATGIRRGQFHGDPQRPARTG